MMTFDLHSDWAVAFVPILGALIIVRGTGFGLLVDTLVTVCAIIALLSVAHIINIVSLLGMT